MANALPLATTQRPSDKHECEFRRLAWWRPDDRDARGVSVPIDPDVLVGEVVLSSRMQRWQIALFRVLLDRLGFRAPGARIVAACLAVLILIEAGTQSARVQRTAESFGFTKSPCLPWANPAKPAPMLVLHGMA